MPRYEDKRNQGTRSIGTGVQLLLVGVGVALLVAGLALSVGGVGLGDTVDSIGDGSDSTDGQPGTENNSSNDSTDESFGENDTNDTDGNDTDAGNGSDGDGDDGDDGDGNDGDGDDGDGNDSGGDDGDGGDGDDGSDGNGESVELTVTVEDGDGNPVEGASVEVEQQSDIFGYYDQKNVDGNGEATFGLADGDYEVSATADGYDGATDDVTIDGDDEEITLTLESTDDGGNGDNGNGDNGNGGDGNDNDGGQLTVIVEDDDGNPVDDASVEVTDGTILFGYSEEKEVNDDGEATFDLENGDYEVGATADGYDDATDDVTIDGSDEEITLTLE